VKKKQIGRPSRFFQGLFASLRVHLLRHSSVLFCGFFRCFRCFGVFFELVFYSDCIRQRNVVLIQTGVRFFGENKLHHRKARAYERICFSDRSRSFVSSSFYSGPCVVCVATVSFPFPGGEIEQASWQAESKGARLGWAKLWGEVGRGWARRGEGVVRSPHPLPCSLFFAPIRSFVSFACPLDRAWPVWSGCEMTCFCYLTRTTVIYSVHEHDFESPWLFNRESSHFTLAIFWLHLLT